MIKINFSESVAYGNEFTNNFNQYQIDQLIYF
jgi:hypothetical protein